MRFASQTSRHIDSAPSIDRSFFSRAADDSTVSSVLLPPLSARSDGGSLHITRRIKIHRGSDDSGVKIHRNATTTGACIFTRVSQAANERFDVPACVGGPSR